MKVYLETPSPLTGFLSTLFFISALISVSGVILLIVLFIIDRFIKNQCESSPAQNCEEIIARYDNIIEEKIKSVPILGGWLF